MKQIMLFLNCAILFSLVHAGVSDDTLVETPAGFKEIKSLKTGDQIMSLDKGFSKNVQSIITMEEVEIDPYVEIITDDDVILRVSPEQRFFVPQKWVQADQLALGDVLFKTGCNFIRIKSIAFKHERIKLQFITIDGYKNFFVSKNGVLIHNGPISGYVGYWVAKSLCYGTAVAAAGTVTVATGGVAGAVLGSAATGATLGAAAGAQLVGGAIGGAALSAEAATVTVAALSAGGVAQAVVAVESFSSAVGWACTFLPLP
ncbi:HINT domain-containing protein [Candidatus Dependentiae bacterium]|nr:HINT domain-containing protein [Candidatus Dependentiae bacterium]